MKALTRAEFNKSLFRALAAAPTMRPGDWLEAATFQRVRYGFTSDKTLARRYPEGKAPALDNSYQKGALLRYRLMIGDDDQLWGRIVNDTNLPDPERPLATDPLYVPAKNLQELSPDKLTPINTEIGPERKRIEISLAVPQRLVAYQDSEIFLASPVTAGLRNYTPRGEFETLYRVKARYMQGDDFDLPGVPFVTYFTEKGHALHGAYWRKTFGRPGSHGCINLPTEKANLLWRWAGPSGVRVIIRG